MLTVVASIVVGVGVVGVVAVVVAAVAVIVNHMGNFDQCSLTIGLPRRLILAEN